MSTDVKDLPLSEEMLAAGFTYEQALVLQRIMGFSQSQAIDTLELINKMCDRLKPEVWL